ncbi:COPII coat assembly protein SEC16 [Colletotrichum graminicola]|uniref:Protein transport protein sec16 n=1 Tax=Colletotrichum graminicola (strain M1.001 / M2 / FGSC 10212) TaxID=645133 RepID=E3QAH8_COLGM|nr:COPII coat assembly protein SEC16 [Colletotrichum graminicola M1.001]EFQ27866.1 COPII coat assembly protein SEC16 [Colletotrichum graminicola M1.001]WDK12235.1 COPII coat assembly protein SEC16 [Colletotrichum graminicola]
MSSETANSSWHPAFMPNDASGDAPSRAKPVASPPPAPGQSQITEDAEHVSQPQHGIQLEEKPETPTSPRVAEGDEEDATDDWPVFDRQAADVLTESNAVNDNSSVSNTTAEFEPAPPSPSPAVAEEEAAQESRTVAEEPKPTAPVMGHVSNNSFTRTVSQEFNWDDDHDHEWSLPRTDTDPFNFMPPSDRTNSFPPVPPVSGTSTAAPGTEEPLPSNQAEEVINEIENTSEHFDTDARQKMNCAVTESHTGFGDEGNHDDQHYVGRDATFTEEEDFGSRYEEGVPLIPHPESNEEAPQTSQKVPGFGEEETGDEDFFSQIQNSNGDDDFPGFAKNQTLERKSTMQAMGDMKTTSSRADTLGEMLEEDDENDAAATTQPTDTTDDPESTPESTQPEAAEAMPTDDLAAKWEEAFADDDGEDFLIDDTLDENGESKPVDPSAFFGSDDEGFLEDEEESQLPPSSVAPSQAQHPSQQGRYMPAAAPQQATPSPYAPSTQAVPSPYQPQTGTTPFVPVAPFTTQQVPPEPPKTQSFAAQSKGGYTSPYDLPMEVVVPKKRASTQQLPRSPSTGPSLAPPRSASLQSHTPPPPRAATSATSPSISGHSVQPPSTGNKGPPPLQNKGSFFEELPLAAKPRSASRQSYRVSSPSLAGPSEPLQPPTQPQLAPSPLSPPMLSPPGMSRSASGGIANLVPGERVNPYAPQTAQQQAHGIPSNARYSPAPPSAPTANGASRPSSSSRYSPAPTAARPSVPAFASPTVLPHLPRTSSPLAHFEVSREAPTTNGDHPQPDRRSSYSLEPRRVPSLPTTREVEEEDESKLSQPGQPANGVPAESRYSPAPAMAARQTPPPFSHGPPVNSTLSPSKRSSSGYLPQAALHDSPPDNRYAPPPRSQTQSPGSFHGAHPSSQPVPQPPSVQSPPSPRAGRSSHPVQAHASRPRGPSQTLNMVAPTDGRENDPLQRWKGAPIISWGVGGTVVSSFPKNVPRYGMGSTAPMIIRSPGEVHVKHVKDIQPPEERLAKFPGPLRGKSKKKETVAWLTAGIEALERELPEVPFQTQLSHELKRNIERVLLWKILRVFVEHDGVLEGTAAVDKAVRDVLAPGLAASESEGAAGYGPGISGVDAIREPSGQIMADTVDSSVMDQIRKHLLIGDREKAVWVAVDKRLWGHAMLISNTVSPDLYKQVAQEFVRKEVNYPGHSNESIAALYKVLSGNHDDCVDELVPAHARAGFQLVNTVSSTGPTKNATEGLDKWRETLGLVLSNRSPEDIRALNALGSLLSSYGRAEAAHICFLFARKASVFGGLDDAASNFVLVGADHKTQGDQFAKETEALLLSEVYEYGLSLAGGPALSAGVPHLAAYKLQHAMTLAEYGLRDKALQYCEALATSINAQTKRSPYHHPILETAVENLRTRLRQAPKEESSSWITKPSMNKVSDTVWSRFNKFVAGDENDGSAAGASAEGGPESGPFARLAGGTPTISRSPSVSNFEPIYGAGAPSFPVGSPPATAPIPATRAASRYAPATSQAPALSSSYEPGSGYTQGPASVGRSSNEYSRSPYEPRTSMDSQPGYTNGGYAPQTSAAPTQGYSPSTYGGTQEMAAPVRMQPGAATISPMLSPKKSAYQGYEPYGAGQVTEESQAEESAENTQQSNLASSGYQPPSYGYEPPYMAPNDESASQTQESGAGGYEPPTYQPYSYEPPSYDAEPDNDETTERKLKPKSFMDDDDDIPALKALKSQEKSKADKDKENEEMFKKAAEEDAKRAAAQQQQKKGWGFTSWFGGKKEASPEPQGNKPVKANLGESSSFVYDPDLKRWVNKKAGADSTPAKTATPPPPKGPPRSITGTPPPPRTMTPPMGRSSAPPGGPSGPGLASTPPQDSLGIPPGPRPSGLMRSVSNTSTGGPLAGPPSRPPTSMSNASSIDDLISAAGPRKPGAKKAKKGGRYVDVMAK